MGIEVNPQKIKAVVGMKSPRTLKEVQSLTGNSAAVNRFISRSIDRCYEFFRVIRQGKKMVWDKKCEKAFQEIKSYLMRAPLLITLRDGDKLFLYLAMSDCAVSTVITREIDKGIFHQIYYVSKALLDSETPYSTLEKLALALVTAARKLRSYFLAYKVIVLTNQPLQKILRRPNISERLVK